jgi:hypothetical protein
VTPRAANEVWATAADGSTVTDLAYNGSTYTVSFSEPGSVTWTVGGKVALMFARAYEPAWGIYAVNTGACLLRERSLNVWSAQAAPRLSSGRLA